MSALLALLLELAGGALLAWRILKRGDLTLRGRVLWALALATPIGAGWTSLLYVGLRALGLSPPSPWRFVVATGAVALLVGLGRRREAAPPPAQTPAPRLPVALGSAALAVAALLAVRAAVAFRVEVPEGAYDAVATWNLRARLLHGSGADWVAALDATNYPLLLPGAIAAAWAWLGETAAAIPHGLGAAFTASSALVLTLALGAQRRAFGLGAAALLLVTPTFLVEGLSQEADVPVAALLVAAAAMLASRLGGRPAPPPEAAGVVVGLAAWTKNEGALWAALVLGSWLLAGGRRSWRDLPRVLAGAAPALAAWALFKLLAAPARGLGAATYFEGDWPGRLRVGGRWREVAGALFERFDPLHPGFAWGIAWLVVGAAALLALGTAGFAARGPDGIEARFWGVLVAGYLAALLPLYVLTPLALDWHLATSLDRLLLQLYPSALAAAAAWAATAAGARPRPGPEDADAVSSRI